MAPSFDCVSSLLCVEDYGGMGMDEVLEDTWRHRYHPLHTQNQNQDGFPLQSDECVALMMKKECDHLPSANYLNRLRTGDLDFEARNQAIHWIQQVGAHFGFGPLCVYLSINYLDRFLSAYELPKGKAWTMQLLAVACLSLAAKMEETEVPMSLDLQVGESKFVFEARTIQRMELLVLSTLRWRMQAITPFSFIDYFLCKMNEDDENPQPQAAFILRSIQIILSTVREVDFLEFKPSEIAAAVAIFVGGETQAIGTQKAISVLNLIQHVDKERVMECLKVMSELSSNISPCVPRSPIGVLEAACFSYKSDESKSNGDSCANSSHDEGHDAKRRKLNNNTGLELL